MLAAPYGPAALAAAALLLVVSWRARLVAPAAVALLAGALIAQERAAAIDRSALGPAIGKRFAARAVALERPRADRFGRLAVRVRLIDGTGRGERVLVRLPTRDTWPAVTPGALVDLRGRLAPLPRSARFERRRGVHAALWLQSARATGAARAGARGRLDALRARAERALAAGLPSPEAALLRGIVLGQDEAIDEPVRERFRVSGLAHLLAVSGQNVALLATLALFAGALAGLGRRGRLLLALALVALYVPLAGGGPSIQRAGVMGGVTLVALLAGRPASRWYALLLAAAATLAVNPYQALDPGWQLSFAAVVALLLWATPLRAWLRERGLPRPLAAATAITVAATAGTAPLMALHFEQVSLVSLPANLLAAPAVAPLMWLGTISAAAGQVSESAAAFVNSLNLYPLTYLGWLAGAAASLPHASVVVGLAAPLGLAGAYCALASFAHVPRARAPLALALAATLGALFLAGALEPPQRPRGLTVSFLDVGQGDATLVQHDELAILVDAGPPGGPILERLRRAGVERIDLLVITHAQADHEGGAAAVIDRHPVALLLDGGGDTRTGEHRALLAKATARGVRTITAQAGQEIRLGPLELRILWPDRPRSAPAPGGDPNDRALVAHLRAGEFDLLLPADAESNVTAALPLPQVEALKVAHHGSRDTGLPSLLERLRPSVAVIEVGARNRYGHPTAQALDALRSVTPLYRTDRDGTVRLTVRGGRMTVSTDTQGHWRLRG